MTDREKLWTAAHSIIEGLRPKFGSFMGIDLANMAEKVAYDNVTNPNKLTDAEIAKVVRELEILFKK